MRPIDDGRWWALGAVAGVAAVAGAARVAQGSAVRLGPLFPPPPTEKLALPIRWDGQRIVRGLELGTSVNQRWQWHATALAEKLWEKLGRDGREALRRNLPPRCRRSRTGLSALIAIVKADLQGTTSPDLLDRRVFETLFSLLFDHLALETVLSVPGVQKALERADQGAPNRRQKRGSSVRLGPLLTRSMPGPSYSVTFERRIPDDDEYGDGGFRVERGLLSDGWRELDEPEDLDDAAYERWRKEAQIDVPVVAADWRDWDPEAPDPFALERAMAQLLLRAGATEPDRWSPGREEPVRSWIADADEDYQSGEKTTKTWHLEGFSDLQRIRIARLVQKRTDRGMLS